jgi:lycopene elongase/hydratase (dihydrobisanhydrobacterioruberin-forming)
MLDPRSLIKISRPRFWLYILGPYLVGLAAGASAVNELASYTAIIFGIYFLFPANLLIYGVNDVFDFETDRVNPKKQDYEMLVQPSVHRPLLITIAALNIPFVLTAYFLVPQALPSLIGFAFFSVFYSAPPIRAKAIPVLDSIFNVLYVFPGAFAYQMLTGSFPPFTVFAAAMLWTMAMHAYSAIPDIEADRTAGVSTVATLLGKNGTLLYCLAAWIAAALLSHPYLGYLSVTLGIVYFLLVAVSFFGSGRDRLFAVYRYFPLVNSIAGFILFWYVAAKFLL